MSITPLKVVIEAQVKDTGEIRSSRKTEGGDSLPSGGLVQTGHVLFIEMLRSESYLMLLSKLSLGAEPGEISQKALEDLVMSHLMGNLERLLPAVVEETLKRVQI